MSKFQKETKKGKLIKEGWNKDLEKEPGVEEGNAFTAALAKAKKGEDIEVGGKKMKDTSNYDDPSVKKEYDYKDNYPGSWGYREGKMEEDDYSIPADAQSGDTDAMQINELGGGAEVVGHVKDNVFKIKSPSGNVSDIYFEIHIAERLDYYTATGWLEGEDGEFEYQMDAEFVDAGGGDWDIEADTESLNAMPIKKEEGLKPAPLQATGQTVVTNENAIANPPMGFAVLSPDEREQLKEYIKTVKTVKEEIKKLVSKAKGGSQTLAEEMGGNRTGMILPTSEDKAGQEMAGNPDEEAEMKASLVKREGHSKEPEVIKAIEAKLNPKLYGIGKQVINQLLNSDLTEDEVIMWVKHEIEEKEKENRYPTY